MLFVQLAKEFFEKPKNISCQNFYCAVVYNHISATKEDIV